MGAGLLLRSFADGGRRGPGARSVLDRALQILGGKGGFRPARERRRTDLAHWGQRAAGAAWLSSMLS